MVWIEAKARASLPMRASRDAVRALILDVCTSGPYFPGVDRIEELGSGRYQWRLAERRTLGSRFTGLYVAEYREEGPDAVSWQTVEGNIKVRGRWHLGGPDGLLQVSVEVTTELDAPVPRLLKAPAQLFAEKEARDGLARQLEGIRRHLGA